MFKSSHRGDQDEKYMLNYLEAVIEELIYYPTKMPSMKNLKSSHPNIILNGIDMSVDVLQTILKDWKTMERQSQRLSHI